MTTQTQSEIEIPSDWARAVRVFWDWGEAQSISPTQWEAILYWLRYTKFDDRNYLAGEAAARLIRDRAPDELRSRLATEPLHPDDWLLHFCIVALEDASSPQYRALLERATQSSHEVVSRTGETLLAELCHPKAHEARRDSAKNLKSKPVAGCAERNDWRSVLNWVSVLALVGGSVCAYLSVRFLFKWL